MDEEKERERERERVKERERDRKRERESGGGGGERTRREKNRFKGSSDGIRSIISKTLRCDYRSSREYSTGSPLTSLTAGTLPAMTATSSNCTSEILFAFGSACTRSSVHATPLLQNIIFLKKMIFTLACGDIVAPFPAWVLALRLLVLLFAP